MGRALVLATISFGLSFAAWGLVGGLASVFSGLYELTASQTALLVAVPVLLGSLARLPMGMLTDRFGGRVVLNALVGGSGGGGRGAACAHRAAVLFGGGVLDAAAHDELSIAARRGLLPRSCRIVVRDRRRVR